MLSKAVTVVSAAVLLASFDAVADEAATGKYLCFVSHMAGIQTMRSDGLAASGNFKPTEERFFIDIHPAIHPPQLCGPTQLHSFADWFFCRATFEVQIAGGRRLRSDLDFVFIGSMPYNEHFLLTQDGSFNSYQTVNSSDGFYVSNGKCTKISPN
jgi:hypothetical protein